MNAYITGDGLGMQIKQLSIPTPGLGQVLVRTRAVALNNADLTGSGDAHVAGFEFSGEVAAVGEDVTSIGSGARVAGMAPGAFAPFVLVNQAHIFGIPLDLAFEDAATLPTALITEYGALTRARLKQGDSVLITAATSGIGIIGVQIAKAMGAGLVITTTRSSGKLALLKGVGADIVVNTLDEDLVEAVRAATDGEGVDVVLDHVAGEMLGRTVPAARIGGSVISVGRLSSSEATIDLFALAARQVSICSVSYGFNPPHIIGDLITALAPAILPAVADGRIRAVIDQVFAFTDIHAAMSRLRDGHAHGKVVLALP
jgi:NADPH2:quinone reductase